MMPPKKKSLIFEESAIIVLLSIYSAAMRSGDMPEAHQDSALDL